MNILFYTILFVVGIAIGGFWATKAHEIPKQLDLKKTHCSNMKNEEFISNLTYILLGGITCSVFANVLKVSLLEFDFCKMTIFIFAMIYISTLVIIAGIDRLYTKIDKKLLAFGIIISIIYMLYLCMVDLASLNLSAIYLAIYIAVLLLDSFLLRKFAKDSYIVNLLILACIILVFTDLRALTYTLVMALIAVIIYLLIAKIQQKKNGNKKIKLNIIPIGYFIAASNVIVLFMIRIFEGYLI